MTKEEAIKELEDNFPDYKIEDGEKRIGFWDVVGGYGKSATYGLVETKDGNIYKAVGSTHDYRSIVDGLIKEKQ